MSKRVSVFRVIFLLALILGILSLIGCTAKPGELKVYKSDFDNTKFYTIVNKSDGKAIQAMQNTAAGTNTIDVRAKSSSAEGQKFQIFAVADNKYQIVSKQYGMVALMASSAPGLRPLMDFNRMTDSQFWLIEKADDEGNYKITNVNSQKSLISENTVVDQQKFEEGDDAFLWTITETESVKYSLDWTEEFDKFDSGTWTFNPESKRSDAEVELDRGKDNDKPKIAEMQKNLENNVKASGGSLVLSLKKSGDDLTGANVNSKGKKSFTYGRFEIWAKLPEGPGVQASIWLQDTAGDDETKDEINFFEFFGASKESGGLEDSEITTSLHFNNGKEHKIITSPKFSLPSDKKFSDSYHLFTIDWEATQIRMYIDGELYCSVPVSGDAMKNALKREHFLAMNISAIAPYNTTDKVPFPNAMDNKYPQTLSIASIKYYKPAEAAPSES